MLQGRFPSVFLFVTGLSVLSFVAGAVVMFYQLPSSEWLNRALIGTSACLTAQSNFEGGSANVAAEPNPKPSSAVRLEIDEPARTFDGFTLYSYGASSSYQAEKKSPEAVLVNMELKAVHRWTVPFSRVFPVAPHLRSRPSDVFFCIFDCRLFPNGDLLVVFHSATTAGCGLAKVDRDANVIWTYPAQIHHDVDVGEDGVIYAIQRETMDEVPGYARISGPSIIDSIVTLSPAGKPLREPIQLIEAFRETPYASLLATLEQDSAPPQRTPPDGSTAPQINYQLLTQDPLHTNCVRVLRHDLAPSFPLFKPGHLLISMRNVSIIALLDPETGKIVWAARGPWYAQHDAHFLRNGRLLLFDNMGTPDRSRVLEYDPQMQAIPWSYAGEGGRPFYTSERGMSQRLPNGNTLIVSSEEGRLFEVTHDKKVVWACSLDWNVTVARRYSADQLPFLDGDQRARP